MIATLTKLRAVVDLALAELWYRRGRTVIAIVAVCLAVLSVTLLASLGLGVVATGSEGLAETERDLWLTGGPPGVVDDGGIDNPVLESHALADEIEGHDGVDTATPLAFHGVYVGTDEDDLELVPAVGISGNPAGDRLEGGEGFSDPRAYYADGEYDGNRTDEIIIDGDTAEAFDVEVNETLVIGTSGETPEREVTVVGIDEGYAELLGTSTVTVPLGELQSLAGTTSGDRAAFVTISLEDDADADAIRADLETAHPEYEVRTNEEQLDSMLADHALVLASGAALVVVAVIAGTALTATLLAVVVSQQRAQLSALRAIGCSRSLLVGVLCSQGFVLGAIGGGIGVLATLPAARALNLLSVHVVGFDAILRPTHEIYALGFLVAVGIGTVGAAVAGWGLLRTVDGTSLDGSR